MPKAIKYIDPNNNQRPAIAMYQGTERAERKQLFDTAYAYYSTVQPQQLDIKEGEPNDNATINLFQQTVDRTVSFLFPSMPDLELDVNNTVETPDEKWLSEAWASNGGISLLQELALVGCFTGHVYVRVMQPDKAAGEEYPQILMLDPGSVVTYWKADNIKKVVWHEIHWIVDTVGELPDVARIEYVLDVINHDKYWELIQYERTSGTGVWTETVKERWNSPFGPIVHWKHLPNPNKFYGKGETDNIDLNFKVNLVASENNRIIRYHSSPKTVGTGLTAAEIQRAGTDELWTAENPDAKLYNLEMKSELEAARAHEQFLYENYLAERRVVILRGEIKDFQRVTNAGVRTVFMDMLSKNSTLRWNYGTGMREISRRLFFLKDHRQDVVPTINHADPLPVDQTEAVNVSAVERSMGVVSRETVSTKRGYTWPVELSKMEQEQKLELFQPIMAAGGGNPQDGNKQGGNNPNEDKKSNNDTQAPRKGNNQDNNR